MHHSQAVLEALRDRPEASRHWLESARATFEELGQHLGLLDIEMHAGLVELLAEQPTVAEAHLRRARDGYAALGSHRRAARAAAALGRALVDLDRLDEAETVADAADGGDDIQATIGLLGVRSELLVRRGMFDEAEALARQAVELAADTDALLDHADAVSLSRTRWQRLVAERKPREKRPAARNLYEEKGSAVGVGRAGRAAVPVAESSPVAHSDRRASERGVAARGLAPTIATRVLTELADTLGQGGDASSLITSDYVLDDRRPLLEHRIEGSAAALRTVRFIAEGRSASEPLATRGEQVALVRAEFVMDIGSVPALAVGEVDGHGLVQRLVVFDPSDESATFAELDARDARGGPLTSNLPVIASTMTAINHGDLATLRDGFAPDASFMDHRLARFGAVTIEGFVERAAALLAMGRRPVQGHRDRGRHLRRSPLLHPRFRSRRRWWRLRVGGLVGRLIPRRTFHPARTVPSRGTGGR